MSLGDSRGVKDMHGRGIFLSLHRFTTAEYMLLIVRIVNSLLVVRCVSETWLLFRTPVVAR